MNVDLYRKVLEAIKANPDHWDQSDWHCGTSHCFAGFCEMILMEVPVCASIDYEIGGWGNFVYEGEDGEIYRVSRNAFWKPFYGGHYDFGISALGLTEENISWLFDSDRTMKDFEDALSEYEQTGEFPSINPNYLSEESDEDDNET